uniref:tRNA-uridine aminocarboxypropyltransferase 1 n=1 Tax=Chromera velia CCMP2878 TaxID=1169474 RepID=A0A0G4IG95_9ALVE|eukprot:Cvel_130.t1-p1 / transcript=Cvel_130.t1 / gene=Cvel_130 / organism=Chromera_velia_CCMP2878 / gene_product=DTW domain-containing protein 1, putative / transcript_product=DTW domain-containing protein 1, putative / location=Cvel_scaffold9:98197-104407(+) / protein_length=388 / sequence_SO=supercontig / SO=protein_coding / is_pseudo=false
MGRKDKSNRREDGTPHHLQKVLKPPNERGRGGKGLKETGDLKGGSEDLDADESCAFIDFSSLKLTSFEPLLQRKEREKCATCGKTQKYYCYRCMAPVGSTDGFPSVDLPLKVLVIRHPKEKPGKSSAIPMRILAPRHVEIHDFPKIPDVDLSSTVLLFPSEDALEATKIDWRPINTLVVVDCTWNQTFGVMLDPKLQAMRKVKLQGCKTRNWRIIRRPNSEFFLSTVEATYFLLRERQMSLESQEGGDTSAASGSASKESGEVQTGEGGGGDVTELVGDCPHSSSSSSSSSSCILDTSKSREHTEKNKDETRKEGGPTCLGVGLEQQTQGSAENVEGDSKVESQFDDLLWFFVFFHKIVEENTERRVRHWDKRGTNPGTNSTGGETQA